MAERGGRTEAKIALRFLDDQRSNVRIMGVLIGGGLLSWERDFSEIETQLRKLLNESDEQMVELALDALSALDAPRIAQTLLQFVEDKRLRVRSVVPYALCNQTLSPNILQALTQLAKDKDKSVRIAVAMALGSVEDLTPYEKVAHIILSDSSDEVRIEALYNLSSDESNIVLPYLAKELANLSHWKDGLRGYFLLQASQYLAHEGLVYPLSQVYQSEYLSLTKRELKDLEETIVICGGQVPNVGYKKMLKWFSG